MHSIVGMESSINPDQAACDQGLCCLMRPICINI